MSEASEETGNTQSKAMLRHLWDHNHPLHRMTVKAAYRVLKLMPFGLKYGVGVKRRRNREPYKRISPGDTVVQVGAPRDLVDAGRSRAVMFAHFVDREGLVLACEPEPGSVERLNQISEKWPQFTVMPKGCWSEPGTLSFLVNDSHPASNLIEGTTDLPEAQRAEYRKVKVEVVTLDTVAEQQNLKNVKLLSITTNGSEQDILAGAKTLLPKCEYVSLARTGPGLNEVMAGYGFDFLCHDDRGYLYQNREHQPASNDQA